MGGMKHFPSARVNTSNMHHNGARYLVFHFPLLFTLKEPVSKDELIPSSVGIKPNFVAVPYLSGFCLDIIDIRRGDIFCKIG